VRDTNAVVIASASICPLIGTTGTRATGGTPATSPAQAPAALITWVAGTNPAGTRTPRTRRASASTATSPANSSTCTSSAAQAARSARPSRRLSTQPSASESAAPSACGPSAGSSASAAARSSQRAETPRGQARDVRAQTARFGLRERRFQDPAQTQARIDAAAFVHAANERGVGFERPHAERFERRRLDGLGMRCEHAGARPRCRTRRLARVDHAHVCAAGREFVRDGQADQSGTDDDDHAMRALPHARRDVLARSHRARASVQAERRDDAQPEREEHRAEEYANRQREHPREQDVAQRVALQGPSGSPPSCPRRPTTRCASC
jgi:hypothetical protein